MEVKKKTVLFLCNCGTNIAGLVDIPALKKWAADEGTVASAEIHNLLCAPDGKKYFQEVLAREKPDRVVVAACSPKMHEKTFSDLAEESGLALGAVQFANIREHCAWVTPDMAEATEKSKALIQAAVRRSDRAEKLERRSLDVNTDLVIIGGGVAGIEAALTAAEAGRNVTVIERNISLGGEVIKSEEVAPNMECAPCLLAPRLAALKENPKIRVLTNAEVTDVLGFYGSFTVKGVTRPRYVEPNCIGCEACFEVCPVSMKSKFHLGLGDHKAVYTLFPGSVPAAAVIDREHCLHFKDGSCHACVEACPFQSINFEQKEEAFEVSAGAVILATGFRSGDISKFKELGHGVLDNVLTLPEFERIASSNGPTGSAIKLKNGEKPATVAVLHCAGSLRPDGIPYCSGVCCTTAVKVGEMVRKQHPAARVVHVHNDLVFPSPEDSALYRKQKHDGSTFVHCSDLAAVKVVQDNDGKGLRLEAYNVTLAKADMVVLATGMAPAEGTLRLAEILNLELTPEGFFKPDHPLLHATGASLAGVYTAGCAAGPCNVSASITRAQAATGHALAALVPGRKIELEVMTACIDEKKCADCRLCIRVCPYKAITHDSVKKVSVVNEVICRGCGTCVASCGTGAASARHYTDEQIYEEIGGLIHG